MDQRKSPYSLRERLKRVKLEEIQSAAKSEGKQGDFLQLDEEEDNEVFYNVEMAEKRFTVLQGEEVAKFRGFRTTNDGMFTPGPSIEDFLENLKAYFTRHNIETDEDKICTLKLLIDPHVGDARLVVANILDSKINPKKLKYKELEDLLKETYRDPQAASLFDAAVHIEKSLKKSSTESAHLQLININKAVQNFIEAFTSRPEFRNNSKSPADTAKEALLLFASSCWAGREVCEKVIVPFQAGEDPRILNREILEFIRRTDLKRGQPQAQEAMVVAATSSAYNSTLNHTSKMAPSVEEGWTKGNTQATYGNQLHDHQVSSYKAKFFCYRCGVKGHIRPMCTAPADTIFCTTCKRNSHVTSVCRDSNSFRKERGRDNFRFARNRAQRGFRR